MYPSDVPEVSLDVPMVGDNSCFEGVYWSSSVVTIDEFSKNIEVAFT